MQKYRITFIGNNISKIYPGICAFGKKGIHMDDVTEESVLPVSQPFLKSMTTSTEKFVKLAMSDSDFKVIELKEEEIRRPDKLFEKGKDGILRSSKV